MTFITIGATGGRRYNPGWHLALDLRNMMIVSECTAKVAREREESRGGHTREDFPKMDPKWRQLNLVCTVDGGGEVVLTHQPITSMRQDLFDLFEPTEMGKYLTADEMDAVVAVVSPSPFAAIDCTAMPMGKSRSAGCGREVVLPSPSCPMLLAPQQRSVVAGYPWFGERSRDTMIALPGLCLVTGRFEDAKKILRAFAKSLHKGLLPDRLPAKGEAPEYTSVDASLWMFVAVWKYLQATGDEAFVQGLEARQYGVEQEMKRRRIGQRAGPRSSLFFGHRLSSIFDLRTLVRRNHEHSFDGAGGAGDGRQPGDRAGDLPGAGAGGARRGDQLCRE